MGQKPLDKSEILKCLFALNADNPVDYIGDIDQIFERNISTAIEELSWCESVEIQEIKRFNSEDGTLWKYITFNFDCLFKLGRVLNDEGLENALSVKESKDLKNVLRNVIGIGILSNLLPNLPHYSKREENIDVYSQYRRLSATTYGILMCLKFYNLKSIVLPFNLKYILSALYQIVYCPVKQPSNVPDANGFTLTQEIYDALITNREVFKPLLDNLKKSVHTITYIRETMMLIGSHSSNLWLKRAVSYNLTHIILLPKGIEHVAWAMLDAAGIDDADDSAKSWKILDVIGKIIMETRKMPKFRGEVCGQLNNLLFVRNNNGECVKPFERLFELCTSLLFRQDQSLCQEVFIQPLLKPLDRFINKELSFNDGEKVYESMSQTIRILKVLLTEQSFKIPLIEANVLDSVINVIFRVYTVTYNSSNFNTLINDVKVILLRFLRRLNNAEEKFAVFDAFVFDLEHNDCRNIRNDVELIVEDNDLVVKCDYSCYVLRSSVKADALIHLMQDDHMSAVLFAYLINCLCNTSKYFDGNLSKNDLLLLEDEVVLDEATDRKMIIYKLLSVLSENENVQEYINENPSLLISYIKTALSKSIGDKAHVTKNFESESFQTLFLIVMLLQVLIENVTRESVNQYKGLVEPLRQIMRECKNEELSSLIETMLLKFTAPATYKSKNTQTEVDKALDDVCNPLLPIRGHGLMVLTKLIERKDKTALDRQQYILNIFQQNLKDGDTYIYLNAIGGLAAMADVFPETVITVLAEEYSEFSRKDSDVRMKIGEVLVRVVKMLGEMAPLYKSLLLNTFLIGTKDDDHLIRASSLSNLSEVCRVLGYKLGSIVSEVLVCVHAIITTDKAPEPRRAAVTVIKQLFAGLEKEMIAFLKDEILPLYRTLKNIYYNDHDDIMKLQAQLALEQLNENMREFVLPNSAVNFEKKIVILNLE